MSATNPEDTKEVVTIEIPDELRKMLNSVGTAEAQIVHETPKGYCRIHGKVGWARLVLYDHDPTSTEAPKVVSEHCVYCLSRVFTATAGKLKYDKEDK